MSRQGASHTPPGGVIPRLSHNTPPGFRGKGGREGKGRDPQGLVDTLHVPNPEKYPVSRCFTAYFYF